MLALLPVSTSGVTPLRKKYLHIKLLYFSRLWIYPGHRFIRATSLLAALYAQCSKNKKTSKSGDFTGKHWLTPQFLPKIGE
jgi:hypothetical protein